MTFETELDLGRNCQGVATILIEFATFTRKNRFDSFITMVNLLSVRVTSWSSWLCELSRDELEELGGDGSWADMADQIAYKRVKELVTAQDWLYDHLVSVEECA